MSKEVNIIVHFTNGETFSSAMRAAKDLYCDDFSGTTLWTFVSRNGKRKVITSGDRISHIEVE